MTAIEFHDIRKTYAVNPPVVALEGVNLSVERGERVAILGQSGSGKSTLLNIMGLLDEPSGGTYLFHGQDVSRTRPRERDALRAASIGFIFQESHVLGSRSVAHNVWLGLMAAGVPRTDRAALIDAVLQRVGLDHRTHSLGRLLSGGEKQRLAVARAVVTAPELILADEPTGNLDDVNASRVLELLDEQAERGVAVVVITHDERTARWADRTLRLVDGRIGATVDGMVAQ